MDQFKIFAPTMIASRESDGTMRIEGIASSTVRDHHGDQLTIKALEKMASTARGLTIFLNHSYEVPEDVFGTVDRVRLSRSGQIDAATGQEIFDLRMGIVVQSKNPRAVQAFESMEPGEGRIPTKLGLSIGAMVPEGGAKFDKSNGGRYIVDDVDLMETSLVSLPANPRSWVDYAVKAVAKGLASANSSLPSVILKQRHALAEVAEAEGIEIVDGIDDAELVPEPETPAEAAPESETITEETPDSGTLTSEDLPLEEAGEDDPTVDHEPVEKTRVTVWDGDKTVEVDTGRARPRAEDPSTQASDGSGDVGSPPEGVSKDLTDDGGALVTYVKSADSLILALRASLEVKQAEIDSLKGERAAAIKAAELAIQSTDALIQQLLDSPMGRKTVIVEAAEQLDGLRKDLYGPDVRQMMLTSTATTQE